ncbi:hypothetical protein F511_15276 [Dorcoceras hygrometricum]|uniref:Uncharacterized protein n=1 Tax=Dorcoceras hygrometricum TaxID=472368 RepID=A0A2Z7AE92_9LAMI|nr:hypothetical protein F511_15276 [Dorcoceras hygrometricum]
MISSNRKYLKNIFHFSRVIYTLQQQYRVREFAKYSELIACLLVRENNNELLMRNNQFRPNQIRGQDFGRGRGRGRGRGQGRGRGRVRGHRNTHDRGCDRGFETIEVITSIAPLKRKPRTTHKRGSMRT